MTDEDRLIELLEQHQRLAGSIMPADVERRRRIEADILELVDTYFRRELRGVLVKVFGSGVIDLRRDDSRRYTDWVHEFFVTVLDKRPDAFWKARTAKDLRTWSSVVIANQMRDYLRRKTLGQKVLSDLALLVKQRQHYFEERYETTFEDFLNQLAKWAESGQEDQQLQAAALRFRYVDGMKWQDIARDLGISDERLAKLRRAAAEQLAKRLIQ